MQNLIIPLGRAELAGKPRRRAAAMHTKMAAGVTLTATIGELAAWRRRAITAEMTDTTAENLAEVTTTCNLPSSVIRKNGKRSAAA